MQRTMSMPTSSRTVPHAFPTTASRAERRACRFYRRGEIYNVCCVVTRYFGGTLLGTGGLVHAYGRAAKLALEAAGVSRKQVWARLDIPCPYGLYEQVKKEAAACGGLIERTAENLLHAAEGENYEWTDMYDGFAKTAEAEGFRRRLTDLSGGRVAAADGGEEYRDFPVSPAL